MGLNAGDNKNYVALLHSNSADVVQVSTTTNVGIPGLWAYQVNDPQVSGIKVVYEHVN